MTWEMWASGIAAAGAFAGAVIAALNYRREKNRPVDDENRRWSLGVNPTSGDGWHNATLKRNEAGAPEVRLHSLHLKSPRGSLLALPTVDNRGGNVGYAGSWTPLADKATVTRKLVVDRDLSSVRTWNADYVTTRSLGFSEFSFFISPPPSRILSWQRSRRVTIIVEAEEISSARRRIRTNVSSQIVDWTASAINRAK